MPEEYGNQKVTIRLSPKTVEMLESINGYIPAGDLPDIVRYCMLKGLEQLRFQQTIREQADVIRVFTGVVSEGLEHVSHLVKEVEGHKQPDLAVVVPMTQSEDKRPPRKRRRA